MPRKYIRELEARAYHNYSAETLYEAVDKCLKRQITIRTAAEKYGIPVATKALYMKVKKAAMKEASVLASLKSPDRPKVFSRESDVVPP